MNFKETYSIRKTHSKKKSDKNYTRMLCTTLNKPWKQHPTKQRLYTHLLPISQTILAKGLISNILLWTPTHGLASVSQPATIYIYQLCEDTGCSQEDLSGAMNHRDEW